MSLFPQYWCCAVFALAPISTALAQQPDETATPAQPAQPSITATPLMMPAQAAATSSTSTDFAALEQSYYADYAEWVKVVTELSEQENFQGSYPEEPAASYYPKFRAHADSGDIAARLWCLENFRFDSIPKEFREIRWQGEAFSLATAVRNDIMLSAKLRYSAGSGWRIGEEQPDAVLRYLQKITEVDEIKRSTMTYRSRLMFREQSAFSSPGVKIANEVIALWPDSEEAAQLYGIMNAARTLVVGGTPTDFTGTDVDGKEIHLYDYRGKVVLIDFWGFW